MVSGLPTLTSAAASRAADDKRTESRRMGPLCAMTRLQIRQEGSEQSDRRQKRADMVDEFDAGVVGKLPQERRANSTHPKGHPEEETGDGADLTGHQFLRVHQDRGEY